MNSERESKAGGEMEEGKDAGSFIYGRVVVGAFVEAHVKLDRNVKPLGEFDVEFGADPAREAFRIVDELNGVKTDAQVDRCGEAVAIKKVKMGLKQDAREGGGQ